MKKFILFSVLALVCQLVQAQIQTPEQFLGYNLGDHFTRHHQVVDYLRMLERTATGKIKVENYGYTNERRELVVAYISSPENLQKLDDIRKKHSELSKEENIAIIWLSYNVHGNEASGTEAAMRTAYELITQRQDWLKNTVVILDPCINPDGRDRYVNWYNQVQNKVSDPKHEALEHQEPWPGGRPNHYLFDLNRDWAWATQVETRQRLQLYNQWLPHVHVDFHEQGINEPYYFAPAAEPYHEVITNWQRDFQNGVGRSNAGYFDKEGWFYFTKEIFDLLYPSYGDTYPTFNGAIGMTYEQAGNGRAGQAILTSDGDTLTLADRIAHHHSAGLSTVEFSFLMRDKLITEYQRYVREKNYKYKSYVLGGNPENLAALRQLLDFHEIIYSYGGGASVKGFDYRKNASGSMVATKDHLVIHTDQVKGTLVNVLFEPKTKLSDSLTYDITAWSLPYAYGLDAIASETKVNSFVIKPEYHRNDPVSGAYAYISDWNSMKDAQFLTSLMQDGIKVRFAENPFSVAGKNFDRGTLIIARGDNPSGNLGDRVCAIANAHKITLTPAMSGLVDKGNDFGSSTVKLIDSEKIAMLTGSDASSLNVGEVWYFFEQELNYPLSLIEPHMISADVLRNYTVLIVPEGYYGDLSSDPGKSAIKEWISNGGKLIAIGGAVSLFTSEQGYSLKVKSNQPKDEEEDEERHEHAHIKYNQQEREAIKQTITGAIFRCKVEHTHPLAFGYSGDYFTLKLSADAYEWLEKGANVAYLEEKPELISGFAGSEAIKQQPKTLVFGQENIGSGCIIYMIDNPLFRGFWQNGKLFFVNALFLSNK